MSVTQSIRSWIWRRAVDASDACLHLGHPWYFAWKLFHSGRLRRFRDTHRGQSCFIIGNGPSLNKMDLSPLAERHTFGLNKIYMMEDRGVNLNLSYHVAVNEYVVQQSVKKFHSLKCPSFISYEWGRKHLGTGPGIYYIATSAPFTFVEELHRPINPGRTVTYCAMQIAYYMGFRQVFLIGVDHNFKAQGKPNELQTMEGEDPNHFAPGYFGGQQWQLPDLAGSEAAYGLARFYFEKDGGGIFDATVGGKLNIFPKVSYEEALAACEKKT